MPLMRHLFYGDFAQAELKSPDYSFSGDTKSEDANEKTPEGRGTPVRPTRENRTDAEKIFRVRMGAKGPI